MHRLIMLSDAYQRASGFDEKDAEDQWLAHFAPRRLEAEELRDSLLEAAGELSLDTGGPGTFPEINEDVARQPQQIMGTLMPAYRPSPAKRDRHRRTIYTYQKRNLVDPFLDVFNGASLNESNEDRIATTVPTQVFALFNGSFVHDMALALASRASNMPGDAVENTWRLALGRAPRDDERKSVKPFLDRMIADHQQEKVAVRGARAPLVRSITSELTGNEVKVTEDTDPVAYEENLSAAEMTPKVSALADLALVLFNSNEFAYVY